MRREEIKRKKQMLEDLIKGKKAEKVEIKEEKKEEKKEIKKKVKKKEE